MKQNMRSLWVTTFLWFHRLFCAGPRACAPDDRERGDVPGWVLVTLMSALLVAGIYAVAGPALINMFKDAIGRVGGM